ncbi:MAG: 3-deoxy-manno-octulosonate cytidylyltransferase [Candidatus Aegiribacteria sp.]|nr:3-deoxy-manno-octulosonate cytidylyltransferase [Candidatus Aegiribacteria sp.]
MAGKITPSKEIVAIVPARFASERLPGKPLADIAGIPMIIRVLQGIRDSVDRAVAATDDKRIMDIVENAGFEVVYTGEAASGTLRVFKAWSLMGFPGDTIINVQGDEPLVNKDWISSLTAAPSEDDQVVTLAREIPAELAGSPDSVKVVINESREALYFSRYPIPHGADNLLEHIGIYAFSPESLRRCAAAGSTILSRTERLEQLAWLEQGLRIRIITGEFQGISVDTKKDLERAVEYFST